MYEDPNVTERHTTAVFTFASDDAHEAEMRAELVAGMKALADRLGYDLTEIHDEKMTTADVPATGEWEPA